MSPSTTLATPVDRRVLEIQLIALAARRRLRADDVRRHRDLSVPLAEIGRGLRAVRRGRSRSVAGRLREARQQIDRAHLVEDVGLAALIVGRRTLQAADRRQQQADGNEQPSARTRIAKRLLRPTGYYAPRPPDKSVRGKRRANSL